jgi:hypothetical protein
MACKRSWDAELERRTIITHRLTMYSKDSLGRNRYPIRLAGSGVEDRPDHLWIVFFHVQPRSGHRQVHPLARRCA